MALTMVLLTACAAAAPSGGLARQGSSAALPARGVVVVRGPTAGCCYRDDVGAAMACHCDLTKRAVGMSRLPEQGRRAVTQDRLTQVG
jgi:hypothetical protein